MLGSMLGPFLVEAPHNVAMIRDTALLLAFFDCKQALYYYKNFSS